MVVVNIESNVRLNPDYILYCVCKPVLVCPLGNKLQGWNLSSGALSEVFSKYWWGQKEGRQYQREVAWWHGDATQQREQGTARPLCRNGPRSALLCSTEAGQSIEQSPSAWLQHPRSPASLGTCPCHTQSWTERILKKTSKHKSQWAFQSPNGNHWQNLASFHWRCGVVGHNLMVTMVL